MTNMTDLETIAHNYSTVTITDAEGNAKTFRVTNNEYISPIAVMRVLNAAGFCIQPMPLTGYKNLHQLLAELDWLEDNYTVLK